MSTLPTAKRSNRFLELFTNEYNVMLVILLNTLVLFFDEFPTIRQQTSGVLVWIDYGCIVYFLIEAILKIRILGLKGYFSSGWNRFDFAVLVASFPSLLMPFFPAQHMDAFLAVSILRLGRLFRFFRLLRFIPNIQHLITGVKRALRASVGIFFALIILNLALSIGATMLFSDLSPEYFGNPLRSAYSLLKVFTIEGWYEIPDSLTEGKALSWQLGLLRGYFIVSVMIGGILGVSLANAVFVDEMTVDNTYRLERMVSKMHQEMIDMHQKSMAEQQEMLAQMREELRQTQQMIRKK